MRIRYPDWAESMRRIFRAATINQFILTGNIRDFVPHVSEDTELFVSLKRYLSRTLFEPFDVVVIYNCGMGIQLEKGAHHFLAFYNALSQFHSSAKPIQSLPDNQRYMYPRLLPRQVAPAIELLDRFLAYVAGKARRGDPSLTSAAVIIDRAEFIVPRGPAAQYSGDAANHVLKVSSWAENAAFSTADIATVLLTESVMDLHPIVTDSAYAAHLQVALPEPKEIWAYLKWMYRNEKGYRRHCQIPRAQLARRLAGLNRIQIRNLLLEAIRNRSKVTEKYISSRKKDMIEGEAAGKLAFIETSRDLSHVAGHDAAKNWLRQDAALIRRGELSAVPMGYLITGRSGTGKTFLVECFAGECGIPCVALKNFRERWVGATEGNLEKIFTMLKAMGQVVVFVDEADQITGRRSSGPGDSGVSGRIYGMLAREMADTRNRGRIIWIFATSRPDLLEVDLKRKGRLDVHIPLFPPVGQEAQADLLITMARKLAIPLTRADIPDLRFDRPMGGNELESLLIRAYRRQVLDPVDSRQPMVDYLREEMGRFQPGADERAMELMDLMAVKDCSDREFLPDRFADLSIWDINERIRKIHDGYGIHS